VIEETLFREGEAVFGLEFCTRLTTWSKNDDELAIGDTVFVIPFRKVCFFEIILPPIFILKPQRGSVMAKAKARKGGKNELQVVNPHAAGIDVGSKFHIVAVCPEYDPNPVRKFNSFTTDLHRLADWLKAVGVTTIAMESTGVYWIPVFEILESRGFDVILVNARELKRVPGRKTDVKDAQWIQQLHQYGLLSAPAGTRQNPAGSNPPAPPFFPGMRIQTGLTG
jgi:hypothetical protein